MSRKKGEKYKRGKKLKEIDWEKKLFIAKRERERKRDLGETQDGNRIEL